VRRADRFCGGGAGAADDVRHHRVPQRHLPLHGRLRASAPRAQAAQEPGEPTLLRVQVGVLFLRAPRGRVRAPPLPSPLTSHHVPTPCRLQNVALAWPHSRLSSCTSPTLRCHCRILVQAGAVARQAAVSKLAACAASSGGDGYARIRDRQHAGTDSEVERVGCLELDAETAPHQLEGNKWIWETAPAKSAVSGPNHEPRSLNVKLLGCCQSVRLWLSFLSMRTVVRVQ
jgi:hypothetical protein